MGMCRNYSKSPTSVLCTKMVMLGSQRTTDPCHFCPLFQDCWKSLLNSQCARPKTWRILFSKCQNRVKLSTQGDQEQNGVDGGIFLVFSSRCILPCGEIPVSCNGKVQYYTHGSWWQTMGEIAALFAALEEELVSEFHIGSSTWCEDAWRGVKGIWTLTKGSYFLSLCVMGIAH